MPRLTELNIVLTHALGVQSGGCFFCGGVGGDGGGGGGGVGGYEPQKRERGENLGMRDDARLLSV